MNAVGVGIDLVDVARVTELLQRHRDRAVERLLTDEERDYCLSQAHPAVHVAARLAAKEAAFKALAPGGETAYLPWRDFEVVRAPDGVPRLRFHGEALATAERLAVASTLLSLTHTANHAAAIVILLSR
jgi:holo-[acyl-carrier protein] synthase